MNKTVFAAFLAASAAIMAVPDASANIAVTNAGPRFRYIPYTQYRDMSGITWAGGNKFYVIRNDNHLSVMTISLDSNGNLTALPGMTDGIPLQGADDPEGIAYDNASGKVWVADERSKTPSRGPTILEYDPITGNPTGRAVPIPAIFKKARENLSFESLTISGDGLTMWTANEEALSCDGNPSVFTIGETTYYSTIGTVVRLVKFTRPNVHGDWALAGMWAYVCEKFINRPFARLRSGVSDLLALPDGSLLVLERMVESDKWGTLRLYRPDFSGATDVRAMSSLENRDGYTAVTKGRCLLLLNDAGLPSHSGITDADGMGGTGITVACYEGICLGPRNPDGSLNMMVVSDGGARKGNQNIFMQPFVRALKLTGLNVHTLNFNLSSPIGKASPIGNNYRFLHGATATASVFGDGIEPRAYTNRGDVVSSAVWSLPHHSPSSGSGTTRSFTVTSDDTFTWNVYVAGCHGQWGEDAPIFMHDTFEQYAPGAFGNEISNWSGEGEIMSKTYTPSQGSGKYVLKKATHTKVLNVETEAFRDISSVYLTPSENVSLDIMSEVKRPPEALEPLSSDVRLAVATENDGTLKLWHYGRFNGQLQYNWSSLGSTKYADGTWVRVSIERHYTSARAYARVRVNGNICPVTGGNSTWALNTGSGTVSGQWFPMPNSSTPSALAVAGTKVDDFIIATPGFVDSAAAQSIVVAPGESDDSESTGPTFTVSVAVPAAAAPVAARPRSASSTESDSFAEPVDAAAAPAITGFGLTVDNRPRIRFTGFAEGAVYRVVRSASLDFKGDDVESLDGDVMDNENGVAVWEGKSACDPSAGAKFYRIEVVAE